MFIFPIVKYIEKRGSVILMRQIQLTIKLVINEYWNYSKLRTDPWCNGAEALSCFGRRVKTEMARNWTQIKWSSRRPSWVVSPQHSVIGKVLNGHRKWELDCGVSGITTYQTFKVVLEHHRKSTMGLNRMKKNSAGNCWCTVLNLVVTRW